jgi:limonene 1,2-monooxygenase
VLLDHLTRGRLMFGVGPGGHLTDARMLGVDPQRLRPMMAEALEVIVRLLTDPSPLSHRSDWFSLTDAVLQLRPYQDPHPPLAVTSMESPAGMVLAGRRGAGVLSLSVARGPRGPIDLRAHWGVAEEAAAEAGRAVRREDWRLVVPMHLAETRRQALDEARAGGAAWLLDYTEGVTGRPSPVPGPRERIIDQMAELGAWVIGTPDDAIAAIERLQERSGGFGGLLGVGHEWAPPDATARSWELLARHVAPRFQGSLAGIEASNAVARGRSALTGEERVAAVEAAQRAWETGRGAG